MYRSSVCVGCGGRRLFSSPGKVAPFIEAYALGGSAPEAEFTLCEDCQLIFCNPRFQDAEMTRLYSGYRGEAYTAARDACEPGYAARNAVIGSGEDELRSRKTFETSLIGEQLFKITSVLDYGGDRGQFIPDALSHADRYVYEVSGVDPLPGVVALDRPDQKGPYDLVMCAHVLEHVPEPGKMLKEIAGLVKPDGLIYIELPAGIPTERYFQASVFRHELTGRTQTFHEHVNAFTRTSIRNLMLVCGIEPLRGRIEFLDYGHSRAPNIGMVGKATGRARKPAFGRLSLCLEGLDYQRLKRDSDALQKAAKS